MNRNLFYTLVLPLLGAGCWARFVALDEQLAALLGLLALAVTAVRWAMGPQTADEADCPPNCVKCAESESWEGDR